MFGRIYTIGGTNQTPQFAVPEPPRTLPQLLGNALSACDPDLRMNLLNHVVLTGGGSLIQGFADRLSFELQRQFGSVGSRFLLKTIKADGDL